MRRFRAIIQAEKEPEDIHVIWHHKGKLLYYENGDWITFDKVSPEDVKIKIDTLPGISNLKEVLDYLAIQAHNYRIVKNKGDLYLLKPGTFNEGTHCYVIDEDTEYIFSVENNTWVKKTDFKGRPFKIFASSVQVTSINYRTKIITFSEDIDKEIFVIAIDNNAKSIDDLGLCTVVKRDNTYTIIRHNKELPTKGQYVYIVGVVDDFIDIPIIQESDSVKNSYNITFYTNTIIRSSDTEIKDWECSIFVNSYDIYNYITVNDSRITNLELWKADIDSEQSTQNALIEVNKSHIEDVDRKIDAKVIEAGGVPFDLEPTKDSTNAVFSGGVYKYITDLAITTDKIEDAAVTTEKLSTDIQALIANISKTATFAGIATPATNPGVPDGPVFYIASKPGVYANFNGITLLDDEVSVLEYNNGVWSKKPTSIAPLAVVKSIQNYLDTEPKRQGFKFIGEDRTYKVCCINSVKQGNVYKITFPTNTWDIDNFMSSIDNSHSILEIYTKSQDGNIQLLVSVKLNNFIENGVNKEYEIAIPDDAASGLYIGGRANEGIAVYFQVQDITDEITSIVNLVGFGPTGNSAGITEQGQTYLNTNSLLLRYALRTDLFCTIPFSKRAVYLYNGNRLFWDGENFVERNGDSFYVDEFNRVVNIRNCGKLARVWNGAYINNKNYRAIWIKVTSGDTIHMLSYGYTDNINIAFSETKSLEDLKVAEASSQYGYKYRTCEAPKDGWILCNFTISNQCFIWNNNAGLTLKDSTHRIPGYIYNTMLFRYSASQVQHIFKVKKGDIAVLKTKNYNDTAVLAFFEKFPVIGAYADDAVIPSAENRLKLTTFFYEVKNDGYLAVNPFITRLIESTPYIFSLIRNSVPQCINTDKNFVDQIDMCRFISIDADDQRETGANWTGQEIINNIYEPLRIAHPEYITRKSLGKDESGLYDIWLYEFNNSISEWFSKANSKNYKNSENEPDSIIIPGNNGLNTNQFCIREDLFDDFTDEYYNLYASAKIKSSEAPTKIVSIENGVLINNKHYYKFTCESNVNVSNSNSADSGIEIWWTKLNETHDQTALIVSGTHGDENGGYLGTALAIKYMVEHHSENAALDYIFRHVKLLVVPVLNIWGANQIPKVRFNVSGTNLNRWNFDNLATEQHILYSLMEKYKNELSFFSDNHTAEWWLNYGIVYSISKSNKLRLGAIRAQNFFLKTWFPNKYPYNWNSGAFAGDGLNPGNTNQGIAAQNFGIDSITAEFAGYDLINFSGCTRYDAQYMKYAIETYLNYLIAFCSLRINNTTEKLLDNSFWVHSVMT